MKVLANIAMTIRLQYINVSNYCAVHLKVYLSSETMDSRRMYDGILQVLKETKTVIFEFYVLENHPQEWEEIKISPYKQKLRDSVTRRPILQQMLKGELQAEIKGYWTVTQCHNSGRGNYIDKYKSQCFYIWGRIFFILICFKRQVHKTIIISLH